MLNYRFRVKFEIVLFFNETPDVYELLMCKLPNVRIGDCSLKKKASKNNAN